MIHDPPLLEIRRSFKRPAARLLEAFAKAETGQVVDAMNGRGALDHRIKPIDPERARFVGVAMTCACGPSDNLALIAACALAQPGDVVMAAADSFTTTAIIGDNVAGIGRNRKLAGIVTDGMARDSIGIAKASLPVFATGVTPNSCVKSGPGTVGMQIVIGGAVVEPGDVVVADRDGVVVVPQARLEEVARSLAEVLHNEADLQGKVAAGLTSFPFMDELLRSDRVRFVD